MPWLLFFFGAGALLLAFNVHFPFFRRPISLAAMSFFAGWVAGEAAVFVALLQLAVSALLVGLGALDAWPGLVGLALVLLGWAGLWRAFALAGRTPAAIEAALGHVGPPPRLWPRLLWPFRLGERRAVVRQAGIGIGTDIHKRLVVDVLKPRAPSGQSAPCLVYVHGGGWFLGFRRFQGALLMNRLARAGWVCVTVEYRLSPAATFPEHLIDVKRGIAWVRDNAGDLGIDPSKLVLAGDSAGGHLTSLAALTPGEPAWQPGFEDADTSVLGCMPCYGIYDLTHRQAQWPHGGLQRLLRRWVIKRSLTEDPATYRAASPWDHLSADAPPFLVVHGERDTMVPVTEARAFVAEFERIAPGRCRYLELPGAQHAFNLFASRRSLWVVEAIAGFAIQLIADKESGCRSPD